MRTDYLQAKNIHIFAWPFYFQAESNKERENFHTFLKECGWKRKSMDFKENFSRGTFMLRQYLSGAARNIFMNSQDDICITYQYPLDEKIDYTYYIEKQIETKKLQYELPLSELELHVYHYGMAILFLKVTGEQTSLEDIKHINDLGRRIAIPFLPEGKAPLLCADRLGIRVSRKEKEAGDIAEFQKLSEAYNAGARNNPEKLLGQAPFLHHILCGKLPVPGETTAWEDSRLEEYKLREVTDDRMPVMTMIRNDELSMEIASGLENKELKEKLYAIAYVDASDATCQNEEMRNRLLADAFYTRWSDWGTLHMLTASSMVCITGECKEVNASVVRPFLTEYIYMLSLVLAQRMGIQHFGERAGQIVKSVDEKGLIRKKQAKTLISLQECYITFKNQMLILEASNQEQGIEIYRKLQQQFLIIREQQILDEQLESLYEVTNVSNGIQIERLGIRLAVIAIVIDIFVNNIVLAHWEEISRLILELIK